MDFRFDEQQERFRQAVRQFIKENLTKEAKADNYYGTVAGPGAHKFMKKLGEAGFLGLALPAEYGGKDMPPIYQYILFQELAYVEAPLPKVGVGIIARTLLRHGTEWQKKEFLPKIITNDIEFALGYSEPEAGSDLASIQVRAVEDGDDYVINGQKLFTSGADVADWVWLMARTDPGLPKHKGISLFLVDLRTPGITIRAVHTMAGDRTCEVFYDDVRVPKKYLVGELNKGFYYAMEALAYERHVVYPTSFAQAMFDSLLEWAKKNNLGKQSSAGHALARLATELEVFHLLALRVLATVQKGAVGDIEASMLKLFGSQLEQRIANTALDIMGPYGQLKKGSANAQANGAFQYWYLAGVVRTLTAGSSEIQKGIIAGRYLGLPV